MGILFITVIVGIIYAASYHTEKDPEYSLGSNWAYFAEGDDMAADLFLIAPTVDTKDEYNMSLSDTSTMSNFVGALNMERGIYEDCTRMYAPFYRQVSMKVYDLPADEREEYLEIAYGDVSRAFKWYLENENNGRPIILAGFSQGADMCYRLLKEYFGDEELSSRLVAVYAIGWPVTEEEIAAYPQIVPASMDCDTGVVVSFECEDAAVPGTFIYPADVHAVSINPLNWRTDSTPAYKEENLGACFTDRSGNITSETPALCGCYIDSERGVLKITDISPSDYPSSIKGLPSGAYHVYDYQFFYRNLQENVKLRTDAFVNAEVYDPEDQNYAA
ncbi:MAG: DUF3089 domain-containing protein [Lachnospiraceae bacterium]|nr:DUF3089 domain-containing protein [Lachnospiraceae bacterium]